MKRLFGNDSGQTGWFDHLLATIAGCLVLHCVGEAVSRTDVGSIMVTAFLIGNIFSWFFGSILAGTKIAIWDGVFYLCLVAILFFTFGSIGDHISDNPFVGIFSSVGFLAWMIVFGSFAAWRDSTLLFQAVPSIAAFGLIGCYDTFRSVTFYFFGFLLCIATLFARINARNMLDYAVRSGATIAKASPNESAISVLRKGPWRSVAGPTWALLSAGIIIVLSLVGAPIVQSSVQGVVGHFRLPVPRSRGISASAAFFKSDQTSVQIGQGPVNLGSEPVLRIRMEEPRYLRTGIYHVYTGHGWARYFSGPDVNSQTGAIATVVQSAKSEIDKPEQIQYTIEMLTARGGILPIPGEPVGVTGNTDAFPSFDGTYSLRPGANLNLPFIGTSTVPGDNATWRDAERRLGVDDSSLWTSTAGVSQQVIELSRSITKGEKSDIQKANAIKTEISRRIVYDQDAPEVPSDQDPVEYTLFKGHVGYCDIFASSMVVMARAANIPARYVTGFYPFNGDKDEAGRFTIKESDAHAWAELYFKGVGWVPFDATEGAQQADGRGRGTATSGISWLRAPWFQTVVEAGSALIAGLAVWLILGRNIVRAKRDVARERLLQHYARFGSVLAQKSGRRRLPEETPEEYLAAIRPSLKSAYPEASVLTSEFLKTLFGPPETSSDQYADLGRRIKEFERAARRKE